MYRFYRNFFAKIFNLCGRRHRGGGPSAAVRSPAARRAPAAAATAAQIENFCEKVERRLDLEVDLRFSETRRQSGAGRMSVASAGGRARC